MNAYYCDIDLWSCMIANDVGRYYIPTTWVRTLLKTIVADLCEMVNDWANRENCLRRFKLRPRTFLGPPIVAPLNWINHTSFIIALMWLNCIIPLCNIICVWWCLHILQYIMLWLYTDINKQDLQVKILMLTLWPWHEYCVNTLCIFINVW